MTRKQQDRTLRLLVLFLVFVLAACCAMLAFGCDGTRTASLQECAEHGGECLVLDEEPEVRFWSNGEGPGGVR